MNILKRVLLKFSRKDAKTKEENALRVAASLHPTKGWRKGESSSQKIVEIAFNNGTVVNLRKQKKA